LLLREISQEISVNFSQQTREKMIDEKPLMLARVLAAPLDRPVDRIGSPSVDSVSSSSRSQSSQPSSPVSEEITIYDALIKDIKGKMAILFGR
jgi:hypothetical protein